MRQMKGITPIIAIIVLLLITLAIAGAAWSYIAGYFGGMVSKGVEVTSVECTGSGVKIYLRNIGNDKIYTASDVTITRSIVAGTPDDPDANVTFSTAEIAPGTVGIATDINCTSASDAVPRYTIIVSGRVQNLQTTC